MAKGLELQLQHQSFQWIVRVDFLWIEWLDLLAVQGTLESLLQHRSSKASYFGPSASQLHTVCPKMRCCSDSPRGSKNQKSPLFQTWDFQTFFLQPQAASYPRTAWFRVPLQQCALNHSSDSAELLLLLWEWRLFLACEKGSWELLNTESTFWEDRERGRAGPRVCQFFLDTDHGVQVVSFHANQNNEVEEWRGNGFTLSAHYLMPIDKENLRKLDVHVAVMWWGPEVNVIHLKVKISWVGVF